MAATDPKEQEEKQMEAYLKKNNGKASKKDFKVVDRVKTRTDQLVEARRTSCIWEHPKNAVDVGEGDWSFTPNAGTDWAEHWDICMKAYLMHHSYIKGRSNLKSPISFAPVEAIMSEFKENNIATTLSPTQESDKEKVKIYQHIDRHWDNTSGVNEVNAETMQTAAILGTSFRRVVWMDKTREVEIILGSAEATREAYKILSEGSEKEKEKMLDRIRKQKKPLTKKTTIVDYRDVVHIAVDPYEYYPDDNSLTLYGPTYEAADGSWIQTPTLTAFKQEYKNSLDPFVIRENVKLVTTAEAAQKAYGKNEAFFKKPETVESDRVVLIHYENQVKDEYVILANDILIRRGPIPYNHKRLTFVRHRFLPIPGQFYGMGIPTIVESLQAEDEATRNMVMEALKLSIARPMFVNSSVWEDVDNVMDELEPNLRVPISGDPNAAIRFLEAPNIPFDYWRVQERLKSDSVEITGINPLAYSMPKAGEPVRNNMMSLESSLKMIRKAVKNWAEGYKVAKKMNFSIMKQKYPEDYVEEIGPGDDEKYSYHNEEDMEPAEKDTKKSAKKKYRTIKTENVQLSVDYGNEEETSGSEFGALDSMMNNMDKGKFKVNEEPSQEAGYFELKGEYLALDGDIDVEVNVDTIVPMSEGFKLQRMEKAFTQLYPVFANPQVLDNPSVAQLVREYIEVNGFSEKLTESLQDETDDDDIKEAEQQDIKMMEGIPVPGYPGASEGHVRKHTEDLILVNMKLQQPNITVEEQQHWMQVVSVMTDHIATDITPKTQAPTVELQKAQQAMTPPQPQMPPEGMMGQGDMAGQMPPMMGAGQAPMDSGMMQGAPMAQGGSPMMGGGMMQ